MEKRNLNIDLDGLDIQILSILMNDASVPYTEVAKKLVVSGGTINVRMKKMEDLGIIKSANLTINTKKISFDICALLWFYLEKGSKYNNIVKELRNRKKD